MAAVGLAAGLMVGSTSGGEGKPEPAAVPVGIPLVVVDEAAGDWVVDRFAGNSTAGYAFGEASKPAPVNPYKGMQERKEVFEFTEKPQVTKQGDKWIITFASKAKCDARRDPISRRW